MGGGQNLPPPPSSARVKGIMIEDFLWWVAEKSWANDVSMRVCVCVCPSILAPAARTAEPIGTGEAPFDAPKRRKYDGANRGAIGARWHVLRANVPTLAKKVVAQDAGQTNQRIRLKLCISIAKLGGQVPLGNRRWRPIGTCHRHVPSDFINSFIAPKRLARSGPGRCHSTQLTSRLQHSLCHVPCAIGTWRVFLLFCCLCSNG